MKTKPTKQELSQYFDYDPATGIITNKVTRYKAKAGMAAGSIVRPNPSNAYILIRFQMGQLYAHHIAWIMSGGALLPGYCIDHINHNGLDNRISNLRLVTSADNSKNRQPSPCNTSGITGVRYNAVTHKWVATIRVAGKDHWLGAHVAKTEAIAARKRAEVEHGFHPNHGSI